MRPASTPLMLPSVERSCVEAFERELDYLWRTLQRLGAAPADAEDLMQEIFLILYRHWPSLDLDRPLRPWLFGVAFRVVKGQRRRRRRESPTAELEPTDDALSPEGALLERESMALLRAALERVPAERRDVLVLHELEGLEVTEIAGRLSLTKFGVYARLYKGRKELASAVRRLSKGEVQKR